MVTFAPELIVTVDVAYFEVSATLVATTLTELELSALTGAVYRPCVEIVPTVEFPPVTLLTVQVTFVLELPVTTAVNCCVAPNATVAVVGLSVTATVEVVLHPVCATAVPRIKLNNNQRRILSPPL